MARIKSLKAIEILDSRGNPTIKTAVCLDDDSCGFGYAPSGASSGQAEAVELRDNDSKRYAGMGVISAISNVNDKIQSHLKEINFDSIEQIDHAMIELDGTPNKSNLGANATLSVSMAITQALAKKESLELYSYLGKLFGNQSDRVTMPLPFLNILNGGKHAIGSTDFQEFMIVPVKFPSFKEALRAGTEIFHALGKILDDRNYQPLVGDEGGFAPSLFSNEQAMELLVMAIVEAKYSPGNDIFIALDPAGSRFFSEGFYQLHRENKSLTSLQMIDFYNKWCEKYPIISIEDPLDQNDWQSWSDITQRIGSKIEIIGDDIYSANMKLLQKGVDSKASTGILIKPNQVGTVTETLEAIKLAQKNGFKVIISHRSGETEDTFIADLAVASNCGNIKAGAPCRSERVSKYNRLLEIESNEATNSVLSGWDTTDNEGFYQL